jgi:hypothetical protein
LPAQDEEDQEHVSQDDDSELKPVPSEQEAGMLAS